MQIFMKPNASAIMTHENQSLVDMKSDYHATVESCSLGTRVHLELTMIKFRHGSLEVIMVIGQFNDLSILRCEKEKKLNEFSRKGVKTY